jgi:hypothetical protein
MRLCGFSRVMIGMFIVAPCDVGMMRRYLVRTRIVMLRRLPMMMGGMLVMLRRVPMMICSLFRHR